MYDFWLEGKDNFAADRAAAEKVNTLVPDAPLQARAARQFLGRAVRFLAEAGIRQFIDLGTGLPTQWNVHQVAQQVTPEARVVYVDYDPVVLVHARAMLQDTEQVEVVQADLRDPEKILQHPDTRALIDFDEPLGLILVGVLYFITDDEDPASILARFRDAMTPGSYVAISHTSTDNRPAGERAKEIYNDATAPHVPRTRAAIARLFDGFDLVEPGLVDVRVWGTDMVEQPKDTVVYAGVGRKPA
ncbi:MAG: methyltransferase domain-containing protein [Streptosporangiales bacterium]|nr:methyltransferase domain-containing protein [Streptosporangiales bacterium]